MEKIQRLKTVPSLPDIGNPNRETLIICALELWSSLDVDVMEVIKLRDELPAFIEQVQALTKLFRRLV